MNLQIENKKVINLWVFFFAKKKKKRKKERKKERKPITKKPNKDFM